MSKTLVRLILLGDLKNDGNVCDAYQIQLLFWLELGSRGRHSNHVSDSWKLILEKGSWETGKV